MNINITSLIDVMFILLIFFMVSSSFIEQSGMKLELPTVKSQEVARIENLLMFVSKDGNIMIGNKPVVMDSLTFEIEKLVPEMKEKTLILKADKATEHGVIIQIMDIAKRSGLKKIVIGTQFED